MSAWVSFCISTFKRPLILQQQLQLLSQQTFRDFEVVVSDNDPEASAKEVVSNMLDDRFRYFHNVENLGMIKSFNKSIERSRTEFVVLVTDDDPIDVDFLHQMYQLYKLNQHVSLYCGFQRKNKKRYQIETLSSEQFPIEILNPRKTTNILWSSSVMRKEDVLKVGCIPDYGSPHLADHAFTALVGGEKGGIIINKMFSSLTSHENNFSKFNFEYYISGCKGFYETLIKKQGALAQKTKLEAAVKKHLENWLITNIFSLKKFHTIKGNKDAVKEIEKCAGQLLELPYLKQAKSRYLAKYIIFFLKSKLKLLR